MRLFNNIGRAYKECSPENTIAKIKRVLSNLGIKIVHENWNHFVEGIYSVRIESEYPYFGANGKGRTKEYALASAYAEYLERLQNGLLIIGFPYRKFLLDRIKKEIGHVFFPDEKIISKEEFCNLPIEILSEFLNCNTFEVHEYSERYFNGLNAASNELVGVPFCDVQTNETVYFPIRLLFSLTGSTGMAAGNSMCETVYQGLCEIFERYAAAYIYYNQLTPPTISREKLKFCDEEIKIIEEIERFGIHLEIKDFSCNFGLPVIGLIAYNANKTHYRLNVGCDTSLRVALSRVLTEIQQGCSTQNEWEKYFLPIPQFTQDYWQSQTLEAKRKTIDEFEKFTENSSGVFPKALFEKRASYDVDDSAFTTHRDYIEEVKHMMSLIESLGSRLYIRDVSFSGFHSVYVYISNNVSCIARKRIELTVNEYDYSSDEKYRLMDQWFYGNSSLESGRLLALSENLYPTLDSNRVLRLSLDKVLRLRFIPDFYLSHLPIAYLSALIEYREGRYENALHHYEIFLDELDIKDNEYFESVRNFLISKISGTVNIDKYEAIQTEFECDNIFSNLELPNCPHCDNCPVVKECLSKRNIDFHIEYMRKCNINPSQKSIWEEIKVSIVCIIVICFAMSSMAQERQLQDSTTMIGLEEVVVTASTTRHLISGDEYIVTEDMRDRSGNISELLNLLPGVRVNRIDNSLSVENKNNVILLVNGKRYSVDYIKSITVDRIIRISITKNPSGRYTSEGYDAVIDLKVRDYDGFDLTVSNFSIINFQNNESDKVMMEQPLASFSYTRDKISIFGSYIYGLSRWNTPYDNMFEVENGSRMNGNGKEKYKYYGNVANVGLNYRIADKHELSVELDYRREDFYSDLSLVNIETDQSESVINEDTKPTYGSSIFYKGLFGDNLNVYSELAYSYLKGTGSNRLIDDIQSKDDKTDINEDKRDIKYTLETELKMSDLLSFKFGYQLGWKRYKSNDEFEYNNTRNKLWAYLNYNPSTVFSTEIGGVAEIERIHHTDSNNYLRSLPYLRLNYNPSDNVNLNFSYTANGRYPTLTMLNSVKTSLHNGIFQQGNPSLKPAVSHKITLEDRFFEMFSVNLQFDYIKNNIAFLATAESDNVIFTYKNTDLKILTVPLNFEYAIGEYFNINADAAYYVSWGQHGNTQNTVDGWWYGANLIYFNNGYMIDLEYNRSIVKENILQGYEQSGIDSWTLTANKQWFGGKLSTMLTWFLPTDFGLSKSLKSQITTDYYHEYKISSLKPYRNAIIVNLTYRFNSGKNKQSHKRSVLETEERISGGLKL